MQARSPIAQLAAQATSDAGLRWLAAALALAAAALAVRAFWRLRGTTLSAPAAWAVAALLATAAAEGFLALRPQLAGALGGSIVAYAARVGTLCPVMAVLGAKRPQDRGWQWVVLSLWAVLLVPAAQAWAAHTGGRLELHALWRMLLVLLIALGPLNYLATKWSIASLLAVAGQALLLPVLEPMKLSPLTAALGCGCLFAAALLPPLPWRTAASAEAPSALDPFSARWRAFRNGWGAFWALRIQHRINESAQLGHWPVRLAWHGFISPDGAVSADVDERTLNQIQQALDSQLRRFERQ